MSKKIEILTTALSVAREVGYKNVTRGLISERTGFSYSIIPYYYRNLPNAIMRKAIVDNDLVIIGQGVAMSDPLVAHLTKEGKQEAVMALCELA